jgi:hypothetical protein
MLITYVKIMSHVGTEKYLALVKDFEYRKHFSKLRKSYSRLKIEKGR